MKRDKLSTFKLFSEVKTLIENARVKAAAAINFEATLLFWHIGSRIRKEVLKGKRAEYGKRIMETLAQRLTFEYGNGYSEKTLRHYLHFAEVYADSKIVSTLSRQLSWSHFLELMYLKDGLQREFYQQMCIYEKCAVHTLRRKISGMLYERTAISRKPAKLIKQELKVLAKRETISPDLTFKDPYFLDFLGLKDAYSENDLESAILNELQKFICEVGTDFAFLARQKRITIDNEDFRIDLLFYHRGLKRLVAIDLKLDKFRASHKGQMELYLRWLEKYEMREGENPPVGLILCTEKSDERIELLQLHHTNIRVAQYLTQLPPRKLLQKKLDQAIIIAKRRMKVLSKKQK